MAKQYDQSDFDQVVFRDNREPTCIPHANDEVSCVVGEQAPLEQISSYRSSYSIPAIANDDTVEQKRRGVALHREFDRLAKWKQEGILSEQEYRTHRNKLLRGALTMSRDPGCSASPTAKKEAFVDGIAQGLLEKSSTRAAESQQQNSKDSGIER